MSNIIQIKHGAAAPGKGVLQPYELGYATNDGILYIGKEDGSATSVGIKTPVPITDGGTNATTAAEARQNLGVNTQDEILKSVYPVGAIYISTVATNPATLFGFGTWEKIEGKFLFASNSNYAAGGTGGATKQTVSLPNHTHSMSSHTHGMAHTHDLNNHTHNMSSHYHSVTAKGTNTGTAITEAQMPKHNHKETISYQNQIALMASGDHGYITGRSGGINGSVSTSGNMNTKDSIAISSPSYWTKENMTYAYVTQATSSSPYGLDYWDATASVYPVRTMTAGSGNTHTHTFTGKAVNSEGPNNNDTGTPSNNNTGDSTKSKTDAPSVANTGNPTAAATMDVTTMPPYLSVYMWKRTA